MASIAVKLFRVVSSIYARDALRPLLQLRKLTYISHLVVYRCDALLLLLLLLSSWGVYFFFHGAEKTALGGMYTRSSRVPPIYTDCARFYRCVSKLFERVTAAVALEVVVLLDVNCEVCRLFLSRERERERGYIPKCRLNDVRNFSSLSFDIRVFKVALISKEIL